MADISSDTCVLTTGLGFDLLISRPAAEQTWTSSDIVKSELSDTRIELHQQR